MASFEGSRALMTKKVIPPTPKISELEKLDLYGETIKDLLSVPQYTNETDVREDFIAPLLRSLGYSNAGKNKIERNVFLQVPHLTIGRKKKSLEQYSPDYILNVAGSRKWLIDAKAPSESVLDETHISQAYSYSIHKEINVPYFVLCNGEEFAVFRTSDQTYKPLTVFKRYELDYRWQELFEMFSVEAFKARLEVIAGKEILTVRDRVKEYEARSKYDEPIKKVIIPRKQASCIHSGTHPYFTKRAWNVVREYIAHFTEPGETVLDSYGGAGVTAIEALLTNRKGIHVDINPIANFMTEALSIPVSISDLSETYIEIEKEFASELKKIVRVKTPKINHWYPKGVRLPENADVEFLHELFSPHQLAAMSTLRHLIKNIENEDLRKVFMLVFSSTLVKCNISYHNTGRDTKKGGGDAGFLKYYRFQVPKKRFYEQDPATVFKTKFEAMLKAKKELLKYVSSKKDFQGRIKVVTGSATNLSGIESETIDYVFTDPPYGSKISYLECSTLWNEWLGFKVEKADYENEVIEGGKLKKKDTDYISLLQKSLDEIHRVLKPDRWFSIVFASENPKYWHAIRDYGIKIGFEHVNTVCQPSDRKTVKKNQNPLTVFRGEMILNFRKRKSGKNIVGVSSSLPPKQYVLNSAELTIVSSGGRATLEEIMQDLIPKLWESGLLGAVSNEIDDVTEILRESFDYNKKDQIWTVKKKAKLGCHIPLEARMKFYLLSALNKARAENRKITIDEIIMEVMPFLRNGITPSNQDIISELKKIAHSVDGIHWQIRMSDQLSLL